MERTYFAMLSRLSNALAAIGDGDASIWRCIWGESILRSIVCLSSSGWA